VPRTQYHEDAADARGRGADLPAWGFFEHLPQRGKVASDARDLSRVCDKERTGELMNRATIIERDHFGKIKTVDCMVIETCKECGGYGTVVKAPEEKAETKVVRERKRILWTGLGMMVLGILIGLLFRW
jgi:hypothetical protein